MSLYVTHPGWLWLALAAIVVIALARRRSLLDFSKARQRTLVATRALVVGAVILALAGLTISFVSNER